MKNRLKITLGIVTIALAIISCNLPTSASPPDISLLENTSPNSNVTTTPSGSDYGPARLQLDDLPDGFRELTEQELQDLGLSSSQFTSSFNGMLSKGKPENFAAFINTGGSFEVIVSVLVAPLTSLETAAVDLYLRDPSRLAGDFASSAGVSNLTIDQNAASVGDSSSSATFSLPDSPLEMNGALTASRHDEVLQIALLFYAAGTQPALASYQVADIVDAKLAKLK